MSEIEARLKLLKGNPRPSPFGSYCGQLPPGALTFAPASPRGYDVTGAWGEAWR